MTNYTILETHHFTVSQASGYRIPGYLIVQSKADCTRIADFSPEAAADMVRCLARAESLVQRITMPERIYVLKFGEMLPLIHFHVIPRTERIAHAYVAEVQDDPPYNGARLVDWIWQNHESLGFTDADIHGFVKQARSTSASAQ